MRTLAAAAASRDRMHVSLSPITAAHPSLDDPSLTQGIPPLQPLLPTDPVSQSPRFPSAAQSQPQALNSPPSASTTPAPSFSNHARSTSSNPDDPITQLETHISQLRRYCEQLLELNMTDSYGVLAHKVAEMEKKVKEMRRERARMLIGKLEGESSWIGADLASLVREEGGRLGYV